MEKIVKYRGMLNKQYYASEPAEPPDLALFPLTSQSLAMPIGAHLCQSASSNLPAVLRAGRQFGSRRDGMR